VFVDFQGPAGRLEALYEEVAQPRLTAIVCHPHPQFGGTMHNHATYRLAKAVRALGGITLRFNYRGVGRSAGAWDRGRGEAEDAASALRWLAERDPELPRYACGFSFGAWMCALAGSRDDGVRGFLLAGLALRAPDLEPLRDAARIRDVERPVAIVQASGDQFASPDEVSEAIAGSRGPRRVTVVEGATHLFSEDLDALQREAEAALAWLLAGGA
jgi:uncharacterized protein